MVKLKNFTKRYKDFTAVTGISCCFESNTITGILGPNGAGKTTILKAITGRHFATEGQVLLFPNGESGQAVDPTDSPDMARRMTGFVAEIPAFPGECTVKEYIICSADIHGAAKESAEAAISLCSLEEAKNKKIKSLSKGFLERLNFAQALVYGPRIIVLDEPASGLDPDQILRMRSLVKALSKDHTIILSTHLMQEAESLCSKIIIINKGRLLSEGTIGSICERSGAKNLESAFFRLVNKDNEKEEVK